MGVLDGLKKNAGPGIAGVLAAGAAGINPALGLFLPKIIKNMDEKLNGRERERLENKLLRDELASSQEKNQAVRDLPGVLQSYLTPDTRPGTQDVPLPPALAQTREIQREADLMGVLGKLNPTATSQSILGKINPREPADIQALRAAGIDPASPRGRELVESTFAQPGGMSPQDELQMMRLRLDIEESLRKRNEEFEAKSRGRADARTSLLKSLEGASRLSEVNERLEGSALETGSAFIDSKRTGLSVLAQAADAAGFDEFASEQKGTLEALDTLKKEVSLFTSNAMQAIEASGGRMSIARQSLLESANASENVSPGTNRSILIVALEELLSQAESIGLSSSETGKYRKKLTELKGKKKDFFSKGEVQKALGS